VNSRGWMGCNHSSLQSTAVHDLRGNLARSRTRITLAKLYAIEKTLGEGSMGSVRLVRSKKNKELYAAKMIQLQRLSDESMVAEMQNEINVLREMDNPHIVRLVETISGRRQITIIMECCSGGDLYARHPYSEAEASNIIRQVLSAINYMHSREIVHRDIKFENVMFVTPDLDSPVKLIDFGLSKKYRRGKRMHDVVGTLYSMAPEVARGAYTQACDLWSIGVVTYMLLSERMPFDTSSEYNLLRAISTADYTYGGHPWPSTSDTVRRFIDGLLKVDPTRRMTAQQAIHHAWIRGSTSKEAAEIPPNDDIVFQIQKFGTYSKLKRTALMVIAHSAPSYELSALRSAFMKFDTEMDGTISIEEFHDALRSSSINTEEVERLFHMLDMDASGKVHYMEFLAATVEMKLEIQEEQLLEAFDRLDSDDSQYITKQNLRDLLGSEYDKKVVDDMIEAADTKGNGKIDFEEFKAYMRAGLKEELVHIEKHAAEIHSESAVLPEGDYKR